MRGTQMTRRGRRMAEQLMSSTCHVQRASGPPVKGPTGELETPLTTVLEDVRCRVRFVSGVTSDVDAAAQLLVSQTAVLSLPVEGTGDIRPNDLVKITSSDLDPSQVGSVFRVTGRHFQTLATARRLSVELVS